MSLPLTRSKMVLIGTFTFSAATASNVIDADEFGKFGAVTIIGPSGALVGTVTLQVGLDDTSGATFATLQSPAGTDVAIASGKAITLVPLCGPQFRLSSTAAETAVFNVWGRLASVSGP